MIACQFMPRIIGIPKTAVNRQTESARHDNARMGKPMEPTGTFGERLRAARKAAKLTQGALAKRVGMSQSNLSELENGEYPSSSFTAQLAEALGVRALWLADGRGPKHSGDSHENVTAGPDVRGRVPLISWVQAGAWSEAVDIFEPGYAEEWLPVLRNGSPHTYALRVQGDSMCAPHGRSYAGGCIIIVDPDQRSPASGQRVIAKLAGTNQVTFKVFVEEDGRRWLKPLNPMHPPIYDEFQVIGTVIAKYEPEA